MLTDAYIGLGSNLNQPLRQVAAALAQIDEIDQTELQNFSSMYLSRPMGPKDQPPYVNAVAHVVTRLSPHALLTHLNRIENEHGRLRQGEHWGPRTLDLDILVYGNLSMNDQSLIIPHPGIKYREFVLYPLHEVNKNLMIPRLGLVSRIKSRRYTNGMRRLQL